MKGAMTNTMKTFIIVLGLAAFVSLFIASQALSGCSIRIKNKMPEPQPLLLKPRGSEDGNGFFVPEDSNGFVTFSAGQSVLFACPGDGNGFKIGECEKPLHRKEIRQIRMHQTKKRRIEECTIRSIRATCNFGTKFYVGSRSYNFSDFACKRNPANVARWSGNKCYGGRNRVIEIGFEVASDFYKLIDICFDDILYTTLYAKATIVSGIAGSQQASSSPSFRQDYSTFYRKGTSVDKRYKIEEQRQTINKILGLRCNDHRYIKEETSEFYLARGHHAANADFVYVSQQNATFHYVNASPLWQKFNNGNWKAVELSVRTYAKRNKLDLDVYTGTHGILTFPNVKGVETELYLYVDSNNNKRIPVPKLFWKAVYEPRRQRGLVIVGINNPYLSGPQRDYLICNDVCSRISWLKCNQENFAKRYLYCCDVNDFRSKVKTLPKFTVSGLLTDN